MTDAPMNVAATAATDLGMTSPTQPTTITPPTPAAVTTPTAPMTPAQAAARLRQLEKDPQWGAALYRGDVSVREEFTELTTIAAAAEPLDAIMSGVLPNNFIDVDETGGGKARAIDQIAAVADMREKGIPDQAIRELLSDLKPTREQHEFGKRMNARKFADPLWVADLMAGEPQAVRDFISNSWAIGCYEEPA